MPTKFELERDAQRLARHQRVSDQIKETDKGMSRETSRTLLLYTGDIVPDPDQPRRFYDEDTGALQELAASIQAVGVLSPIQVRPNPEIPDKYMIIVGERRWRACQMAGVNRIEAVVREDWDPFQIRAAQYEENEKRQDVSDIARARSLTAMRQSDAGKKRGWEEIAARLGLQRNHAMRLVGLLQLPDGAVSLIDRRFLPGTHGAELVRLLKRVPDQDIVTLAESCASPMPGGKARCPVKELARTVTERLQAVHEQQASHEQNVALAEEQHTNLLQDCPTDRISLTASQKVSETPAYENLGTRNQETKEEGIQEFLNTESDTQQKGQGTEIEFGYPRTFVQELIQAWKSNRLTVPEQRLIREAWQSHPLLNDGRNGSDTLSSNSEPVENSRLEDEKVFLSENS
jgi:ParB/RepB/Spo0J family partition protein